MTTRKLKDCPFCGSSNPSPEHDGCNGYGYITCAYCKTKGPHVADDLDHWDDEASLAWNDRDDRE